MNCKLTASLSLFTSSANLDWLFAIVSILVSLLSVDVSDEILSCGLKVEVMFGVHPFAVANL